MRFRKYEILADRCKFCGGCLENCPEGAIERTERDVCEINEDLCSYCGICKEVCQLKAVKLTFSVSTFLKSLRFSLSARAKRYVRKEQ